MSYDLELTRAALLSKSITDGIKAAPKRDEMAALLVRKGDVAGHEFHGNQYTGGGSNKPSNSKDLRPELVARGVESAARRGAGGSANTTSMHTSGETDHSVAVNTGSSAAAQSSGAAAREYLQSAGFRQTYEEAGGASTVHEHPVSGLVATVRTPSAKASGDRVHIRVALGNKGGGSVAKGDVAGHEFHGNQWTGGEGHDGAPGAKPGDVKVGDTVTYANPEDETERSFRGTVIMHAPDAEPPRTTVRWENSGMNLAPVFTHSPGDFVRAKSDGVDLKVHSNYDKGDYDHLKGKGYTDKEIKTIWDADKSRGVTRTNAPKAPDVLRLARPVKKGDLIKSVLDPKQTEDLHQRAQALLNKGTV